VKSRARRAFGSLDRDVGEAHVQDLVGCEVAAQRLLDVGSARAGRVAVVLRELARHRRGVAGVRRRDDPVERLARRVALLAARRGQEKRQYDGRGSSRPLH